MTAKILVVDDSITIQKIVAMAFENEDASVQGIGDGSEALAKLKTFHPDIVLADVDMPGLTGFELSRKIKESETLNSIFVLLLASDFEEFDENQFRSSLADDHITKPFKSEDLVRKVMEILDGVSPRVADEETEDLMIELSPTDRVEEEEEVFLELGANQLVDSVENVEDEQDLPLNSELTDLDNNESSDADEFDTGIEEDDIFSGQLPEEDLPDEVISSDDDQVELETTDQEENIDELLRKVEELSKKSEAISDNGFPEELSPMEAIDEMLKEVNALKGESFFVDAEEENNFRATAESQSSSNPAESQARLAEVDYISEENAEALETAFNEITNGKKHPTPAKATLPPEGRKPFFQEDAVEDLSAQELSTPHESPLPDDNSEENLKSDGELQLLKDKQLTQLLETEVRRILKQSLASLIEKEMSGLSERIIQTVEENVRNITPGIAKSIIEKEIAKIKTMEDG